MLKPVLDVAVPALVFLAMVVVGLGLTAEDFWRVARRPRVVALATAGQAVLVPLAALGLVRCLALSPPVATGVLLVAACPAGSMANLYAHLARANVALAVSLTSVSCLAAVLTMPLALAAFRVPLGESAGLAVPVPAVVRQLLLTLVLPVAAGMAIRRFRAAAVERHQGALFGLSVAALAALIVFVLAQEAELVAGRLGEIALAVAALTGLALAAGWATGWAAGAGPADRFPVALVFAVCNVGIATVVAVTVLGRTEFAAFAAAYFLSQVPLLLAAVLLFRGGRAPRGVQIEADQP